MQSTSMLGLCLLLLTTLSNSDAAAEPNSIVPRCDKRLDVIKYSEWPTIQQFSRELTDNALLVAVGFQRYIVDHARQFANRAVLHDRRKRTYLHELYPEYNVTNGPCNTRELVEISGLSVKDIKLGDGFISILTADGAVWTAGVNDHGQLSVDTVARCPIFTKVQGLPQVKQIATGHSHCIVLAEDGELFSWGNGYYRALGRIPVSNESNPTPRNFSLSQGAIVPISICCSYYACMALTEHAEVFTWGSSNYIGRSGGNVLPGRLEGIPSGEAVMKVVCGEEHMAALTVAGRLYGWGISRRGAIMDTPGGMPYASKLDLGRKVVRDVEAGRDQILVRTDTEEVYYIGSTGRGVSINGTLVPSDLYPRDLMANTYFHEDTYGAVKLGCE